MCVITVIGTAYTNANNFFEKALAVISFWWVFFILFYISEKTDKLRIEELNKKFKKVEKDFNEISNTLYMHSEFDSTLSEKQLNNIVDLTLKMKAEQEELED